MVHIFWMKKGRKKEGLELGVGLESSLWRRGARSSASEHQTDITSSHPIPSQFSGQIGRFFVRVVIVYFCAHYFCSISIIYFYFYYHILFIRGCFSAVNLTGLLFVLKQLVGKLPFKKLSFVFHYSYSINMFYNFTYRYTCWIQTYIHTYFDLTKYIGKYIHTLKLGTYIQVHRYIHTGTYRYIGTYIHTYILWLNEIHK